MDPVHLLLDHAEQTSPERLPARVIDVTKRFILDTLAVMAAGSRLPGCGEVVSYVGQWRGGTDAMLVTGDRVAAPYAALCNSMMAHAAEFDDTYEPADVHGYAVVLPAVLAMAERDPGRSVSGAQIVAAVTLGIDVAYRMGAAIRHYRGWHPTATCGIFGATLAAGRIAGCSRSQLHNAMGIAYSLASGNFQAVVDGSLSKRLQPGFAARGAVEAVLLALAGITGARDILEGTFGFYPLYEAHDYDITALTDGLGERFAGEQASMKPYPCCRFCHAPIDAALVLAVEADITPDQIAAVAIEIPEETLSYVGGPYAPGDNPSVSAQFSVAYAVAVALLHRKVGLAHFALAATREPRLLRLAARVETSVLSGAGRYGGAVVRIGLHDGRTYERRVSAMKGEPSNPMTEAERLEKVASCIAFAGWPAHAATELSSWAATLDRTQAPLAALHAIFRNGATP